MWLQKLIEEELKRKQRVKKILKDREFARQMVEKGEYFLVQGRLLIEATIPTGIFIDKQIL
jgi:RNase P/RNase MRP subunit p29